MPLADVCELFQALQQEWVAIPEQVFHNLSQSMPRRLFLILGKDIYPLLMHFALKSQITA